MSDEANGNGRLDRIEENIKAIAENNRLTSENLQKLTEAHLRHEFTTAERRTALEKEFAESRAESDQRFARIESVLAHLTELVGVVADKTFEIDEKIKRVKDAL